MKNFAKLIVAIAVCTMSMFLGSVDAHAQRNNNGQDVSSFNNSYSTPSAPIVKFEGLFVMGYGASLDYQSSNLLYLQTFYGLRIADVFFAGVGVSYDNRIYIDNRHNRHWEDSFGLLGNVRFYAPSGSGVVRFFADVTGGYLVDASRSDTDGYSINPSVGINIDTGFGNSVSLSIGYDWQQWQYRLFPRNTFTHDNNAVSFKLGFVF